MQPYRRSEVPLLGCTCCQSYLLQDPVQKQFAATESRETPTSTGDSRQSGSPFHVGTLLSQNQSQTDALRFGVQDRRATASTGTVTCDPFSAVRSQDGYSFSEFGLHFTDKFLMTSYPAYKEDTTTGYVMSKEAKQPGIDKPHPTFLVPKRVRTMFTMEQLDRLENEFSRRQYVTGAHRMFLAQDLSLSETQVRVWFQNRRIKWRKQMMEKQQGTQFYWKTSTIQKALNK